jgi:hypothetical protein
MSKAISDGGDSPAELTRTSLPGVVSISEIARQTGLNDAILRAWEHRYGWPRPLRLSNRYRAYPITLVPLLRAIHAELKQGKNIGDLLRDPEWVTAMQTGELPAKCQAPAKPRPDWSQIPWPVSFEGQRLRRSLELALENGEAGTVARLQAEGVRLRSADRNASITAVIEYWQQFITTRE